MAVGLLGMECCQNLVAHSNRLPADACAILKLKYVKGGGTCEVFEVVLLLLHLRQDAQQTPHTWRRRTEGTGTQKQFRMG